MDYLISNATGWCLHFACSRTTSRTGRECYRCTTRRCVCRSFTRWCSRRWTGPARSSQCSRGCSTTTWAWPPQSPPTRTSSTAAPSTSTPPAVMPTGLRLLLIQFLEFMCLINKPKIVSVCVLRSRKWCTTLHCPAGTGHLCSTRRSRSSHRVPTSLTTRLSHTTGCESPRTALSRCVKF